MSASAFMIFRKPFLVKREGQGKFVDGCWQKGVESCFMIFASLQGTNALVLQTMPEGIRNSASYTLRTSTKLTTGEIEVSTPDIVTINDERFVVMRVTSWENIPQTQHYEIIVVKENIDAN